MFRLFCKVVLFCLITNGTSKSAFSQAGTVPVISPVGGFSIDGYLQRQGAGGDWFGGPGGNQAGSFVIGGSLNQQLIQIVDPYGNGILDNVFTKGRFQDNPNSYKWTLKKASARTDIAYTAFFITSDQSNNAWVIIHGDRRSPNGKSILEFEFSQNPNFPVADLPASNGTFEGRFISFGPHGGRTVGDIIISIGFNGAFSTISFYKWEEVAAGSFMYIPVEMPPGTAYAAFNGVDVNSPYTGGVYPAGTFAEAAVNMTALMGGQCIPLANTFRSIIIKSRPDNGSLNENYDDFVSGPLFSLSSSYSLSVEVTFLDLLTAQLTSTVSPGTVDDYYFTWSPIGALLNDVLDPAIAGTLNNYNIYNPIFSADPDHPCLPYLYEVVIAEKNNPGCVVARTHVVINNRCKIGKPINPDKLNHSQEAIKEAADNAKGIIVYPNPSKGTANIILPADETIRDVELLDIKGAVIQQWMAVLNNNVQIKNVPAGLYLARITTRSTGKVIIKKIIINR